MTGKLKHLCIIVCITVLALLLSACSGDIPTSSEDMAAPHQKVVLIAWKAI